MNEIKKEGLERVLKRHEDNVSNIQAIVSRMIETGFTISTKELDDLAGVCALLDKQAEAMAAKDASRIKIAFKREEDYKETLERLQTCISENAHELRKALLYHTAKPLDVDAYEMLGNMKEHGTGLDIKYRQSAVRSLTSSSIFKPGLFL